VCPPGDLVVDATPDRRRLVDMPGDEPTALLYVLAAAREEELMLRIHDSPPSNEDLAAWMRDRTVRSSTVLLNFADVVGARIAPYSGSATR
jgi:hypothetical protein